jgi:hypothetical protein
MLRWAASILVGLTLCAGSLWLWRAPLRGFILKSDDFVYVAWSRTSSSLWKHLFWPFNRHVVPLFLLETHALARVAGSLEALPVVLSWASYATMVVAMAVTGHVVARESGRVELGLAAMAAVGLTTVLGPSLLWYAAGQALVAGTMVVLMLAALQAWRIGGSRWAMAAGLLAATAAPLVWSGGYVASPVGMAYLWADGRRACRRAAVLIGATCLTAAVLVAAIVYVRGFGRASQFAVRPTSSVMALRAMTAHSAQAVCEALILNNLGLDAATTPSQALVVCAVLATIWFVSRRPSGPADSRSLPRINPLEAAGATLVITTYGLIFSARGTESNFDSLRALGWYDAMAALGAVLFGCGWYSGCLHSPPPRTLKPPGWLDVLRAVLFSLLMFVLQAPRAERVIFEYDEMAAPVEPRLPAVVVVRSPADLAARATLQRHALAALDRLEAAARRGEIDRAAIRQAIASTAVPGMPAPLPDFEPADLLDISGDSSHPREPGDNRR